MWLINILLWITFNNWFSGLYTYLNLRLISLRDTAMQTGDQRDEVTTFAENSKISMVKNQIKLCTQLQPEQYQSATPKFKGSVVLVYPGN